jgi:hypothetical protein
MPRYRTAYPPEFRRQMVDLVRSGRSSTLVNCQKPVSVSETEGPRFSSADRSVAASTSRR